MRIAATRLPGETRAALIGDDGEVLELRLFRGTPKTAPGAVWRGRTMGTVASARAVLVDLGGARPALLPLADWPEDAPPAEGAPVLVTIEAMARAEKGPRVSGLVRLVMPRLILSPFRPGVSVSHRLEGEPARTWRRWAEDGAAPGEGWVVRGAAAHASPERLERERARLRRAWTEIRAALAAGGPPACLAEAPDPLAEWLADLTPAEVAASAGPLALAARAALADSVPVLASLADPFAEAGGEDALAHALSPLVPLPCGGRMAIQPTRAFWAVDVDAGPAAPAQANEQAIAALAREIRLRNLGGAVVIDPIPETRRGGTSTARRLLARLRELTAGDSRMQESAVTPLGHIELIRSRAGAAIAEIVQGDGLGEGDADAETAALAALAQVVKDAREMPGGEAPRLAVGPRLAGWLDGPGRDALAEAEAALGHAIARRIAAG